MNTPLRKIGASYDKGTAEFIVWAPSRHKVELVLESPVSAVCPMEKDEAGYWRVQFPAAPGVRYFFRLDDSITCPDPASRCQPDGVHGPSLLLSDHSDFQWEDDHWMDLSLANRIIYELHTGAFSPTHDFDGIRLRLDYLVQLGINTIELMPLAQFPGDRNWGYDGVYPFALQYSYGGVAGFQRLVNAAHTKGISVIVDVVYNHFGPEGNYLDQYGPYFTDKYKTPWGRALNFDDRDSDAVRNFFLQNARMWLEDYHVDALRLDAVHAIRDFSAVPFVRQLKDLARGIGARTGRKKEIIAEIDLNDPRYINPGERGGYGLDGQWIDEFHHSLRTLLTGEKTAYYADFGEMAHLEKAFRDTYVYNGVYSPHRGWTFGAPVDNNPYDQFVVFAQNHDQVGNRALGDRLTNNLSFAQLKLAAAAVLLSPYVPLLFMGEEYGESNPFQFFVSFGDPALIESVRKGRTEEFKGFHNGEGIPDPESEETFSRSVLSWRYDREPGATLLRFYQHLIGLRRTRPGLQGRKRDSMVVFPAVGKTLLLERKIPGDRLLILLHFDDQPVLLDNPGEGRLVKIFDTAAPEWGGEKEGTPGEIAPGAPIHLAPWSAVVFECPLPPSS